MVSSKGLVVVGEEAAGGAGLLGGLVVPDGGGEGEESIQLLVLEITGAIGSEWRHRLGDAIDTAAFPTWSLWISGLVGAGVALVGLVLVVAQLAPARKGLTRTFEVYRAADGETRIRGRAAIHAARHEAETIEGVLGVDGRIRSKRLHLTLRIDDRINLADVENEARRAPRTTNSGSIWASPTSASTSWSLTTRTRHERGRQKGT